MADEAHDKAAAPGDGDCAAGASGAGAVTATPTTSIVRRLQLLIHHGLGEVVGCLAGYDGGVTRADLVSILSDDLATAAARVLQSTDTTTSPGADHAIPPPHGAASTTQARVGAKASTGDATGAPAAAPARVNPERESKSGAAAAADGDTAMVSDTRAPKARRWQPPPVGSASAKLQRVVVTSCLSGGDGWADALAMLVAPDATTRHGVNAAALADAAYVLLRLACDIGHVDVWERALASDAACVKAALSTASYTSVPLFVSACQEGHAGVVQLLLASRMIDEHACDGDGVPGVVWACTNGHAAVCKLLLDAGHKVTEGDPLLTVAATHGHTAVVDTLLQSAHTDPNGHDSLGLTALHTATVHGHAGIVAQLLRDRRADPNAVGSGAYPCALVFACSRGREAVVRALLSDPRTDVNVRDDDGMTPAMHAAWRGHAGVVAALVEHGADLTLKDDRGCSAAFWACSSSKPDVLRYLATRGIVDVERPVSDGRTPFHMACSLGHLDTVKFLVTERGMSVRSKQAVRALWTALAAGRAAVVRFLLEHGADVTTRDNRGRTPLLHAARGRSVECVDVLLGHRAVYVEEQDTLGDRALHLAAAAGQADIFKLLVTKGRAKMAALGAGGRTCLSYAAAAGSEDITSFILQRVGGDPDPPQGGREPWRPAHQAALCKHPQVLRLLLADPRTKPSLRDNNTGRTALHLAVKGGSIECVRMLLDDPRLDMHQADDVGTTLPSIAACSGSVAVMRLLHERGVDFLGDQGLVPLAASAADRGALDCLRFLVEEAGVDINATYGIGKTALHACAQAGSLECLRYLLSRPDIIADPSDQLGSTPLVDAADNEAIVAAIIRDGRADLNAGGINGQSVAWQAACFGHVGIVRLLLSLPPGSVDWMKQHNYHGQSPVHRAATHTSSQLLKMIRTQPGVDLTVKDVNGRDTLGVACHHGASAVVRMLCVDPETAITGLVASGVTPTPGGLPEMWLPVSLASLTRPSADHCRLLAWVLSLDAMQPCFNDDYVAREASTAVVDRMGNYPVWHMLLEAQGRLDDFDWESDEEDEVPHAEDPADFVLDVYRFLTISTTLRWIDATCPHILAQPMRLLTWGPDREPPAYEGPYRDDATAMVARAAAGYANWLRRRSLIMLRLLRTSGRATASVCVAESRRCAASDESRGWRPSKQRRL